MKFVSNAKMDAFRESKLFADLASVVDDPEEWLHTPNPLMPGFTRPIELVGTPDETFIVEWIGQVQHGYLW